MDYAAQVTRAVDELTQAATAVDPVAFAAFAGDIAAARRIVLYGAGREGLMMRALAMRLYHLGLDAHVIGEMATPPLGTGDLLLVSAGPGDLSTVSVLVALARGAGARTACVTAQPHGAVPMASDRVLTIPAQTMANDQGANDQGTNRVSALPMGSVFEGAQFLVFEMLILWLRDALGVTLGQMRERHTNLE